MSRTTSASTKSRVVADMAMAQRRILFKRMLDIAKSQQDQLNPREIRILRSIGDADAYELLYFLSTILLRIDKKKDNLDIFSALFLDGIMAPKDWFQLCYNFFQLDGIQHYISTFCSFFMIHLGQAAIAKLPEHLAAMPESDRKTTLLNFHAFLETYPAINPIATSFELEFQIHLITNDARLLQKQLSDPDVRALLFAALQEQSVAAIFPMLTSPEILTSILEILPEDISFGIVNAIMDELIKAAKCFIDAIEGSYSAQAPIAFFKVRLDKIKLLIEQLLSSKYKLDLGVSFRAFENFNNIIDLAEPTLLLKLIDAMGLKYIEKAFSRFFAKISDSKTPDASRMIGIPFAERDALMNKRAIAFQAILHTIQIKLIAAIKQVSWRSEILGNDHIMSMACFMGMKSLVEWGTDGIEPKSEASISTSIVDCFAPWLLDNRYQYLMRFYQSSNIRSAKNLIELLRTHINTTHVNPLLILFLYASDVVINETKTALTAANARAKSDPSHQDEYFFFSKAYRLALQAKQRKEVGYYFLSAHPEIDVNLLKSASLIKNQFIQHCLQGDPAHLLERKPLVMPWNSRAPRHLKGRAKKAWQMRHLTIEIKSPLVIADFFRLYRAAKEAAQHDIVSWCEGSLQLLVDGGRKVEGNMRYFLDWFRTEQSTDDLPASLQTALQSEADTKKEAKKAEAELLEAEQEEEVLAEKALSKSSGKRRRRRKNRAVGSSSKSEVKVEAEAESAASAAEPPEGLSVADIRRGVDISYIARASEGADDWQAAGRSGKPVVVEELATPPAKSLSTPRSALSRLSFSPASSAGSTRSRTSSRSSTEIPTSRSRSESPTDDSGSAPRMAYSVFCDTTCIGISVWSPELRVFKKAFADYQARYQSLNIACEALYMDQPLLKHYANMILENMRLKLSLLARALQAETFTGRRVGWQDFKHTLQRLSQLEAVNLDALDSIAMPSAEALADFQAKFSDLLPFDIQLLNALQQLNKAIEAKFSSAKHVIEQVITCCCTYLVQAPEINATLLPWIQHGFALHRRNLTCFMVGTRIFWPTLADDVDLIIAPTHETKPWATLEAEVGGTLLGLKDYERSGKCKSGEMMLDHAAADVMLCRDPLVGDTLTGNLIKRLHNVSAVVASLASGFVSILPESLQGLALRCVEEIGASSAPDPLRLKNAWKAAAIGWQSALVLRQTVANLANPLEPTITCRLVWGYFARAETMARLVFWHNNIQPIIHSIYNKHGLGLPPGTTPTEPTRAQFDIMLRLKSRAPVNGVVNQFRIWYYLLVTCGLLQRICHTPARCQPYTDRNRRQLLVHPNVLNLLQDEKLSIFYMDTLLLIIWNKMVRPAPGYAGHAASRALSTFASHLTM